MSNKTDFFEVTLPDDDIFSYNIQKVKPAPLPPQYSGRLTNSSTKYPGIGMSNKKRLKITNYKSNYY